MQPDLLRSLNKTLYPSESVHQAKIEGHFGRKLLRPLSPGERGYLQGLDLFFVVFTNRSGSTYLTELLHLMGAGNQPHAEQFNEAPVLRRVKKAKIPTFTDYLLNVARQQRKVSQGNRIGYKIGPAQLFWLTRLGVLEHFRSLRLIYSLREDRVAQAVSHMKASATGRWHTLMPIRRQKQVAYSRKELLKYLRGISRSQELFDYYCSLHQPQRLDVVYEQVLEDPCREMARMADFLGMTEFAPESINLDAVRIQQQRDEDNERLCRLFREEFSF